MLEQTLLHPITPSLQLHLLIGRQFIQKHSVPVSARIHNRRVTERNRTAAKQIHSLSPETSTGPGHSGRSGIRTRKAHKCSTGFQPAPVANRVALPFFTPARELAAACFISYVDLFFRDWVTG